jgi:hypothetical protein
MIGLSTRPDSRKVSLSIAAIVTAEFAKDVKAVNSAVI